MKTTVLLATALVALAACSDPAENRPALDIDGGGVSTGDDAGSIGDSDAAVAPDAAVDSGQPMVDAGPDTGASEPDMADNRVSIGTVWNTYYWLADEAEHPGAKTVELLDQACEPVGTVSEDYADALCIEGSGKLDDGTIVNYASLCDCGRPCSSGNIICWSALDGSQFPWGQGSFSNALVPLRSLAVDREFVAIRTVIYIAQFDGLEIPALGGVSAFTHDGCFRADDVGGGIDGNHIDIMAGTTEMWRHMETVYPTRSDLDAYTGVAKCEYLEL
jgi:3D (Asp-Asp-Asp) domain-containing protein